MSAALSFQTVVRDYTAPDGTQLRVLDIEHLDLAPGAELAIAGPSGSGKTTLLHLAAGLLLPTAGTVTVLGEQISRMAEARRDRFRAAQIGYVFQRANLLDGFSALENLQLAMGFATVIPPKQRRMHASELLEQVGLSDRMHHRPAQLSSGQQQRVALARALVNRPALVLADEPTASVDYDTGRKIVALLREFSAAQGAALALVSHDRELLASFGTHVALRAGRLEATHAAEDADHAVTV